MMDYNSFDFLGNLGVITILWCYLSLQLGKMNSKDLMYSSLNALGAMLILISLFEEFNLSAFLIESFWLLISSFGIITGLTRYYREHYNL
jgi:hypothetical protein